MTQRNKDILFAVALILMLAVITCVCGSMWWPGG